MDFIRALVAGLLSAASIAGASGEVLEIRPVGPGVFALIGSTGPRSFENHALNANFGVIATPEGSILIDSGASTAGAKLLEAMAQTVAGTKVRWVINTGSQDHRWLGNAHFIAAGAEVIALSRTVATQQANATGQLDSLKAVLKERLAGTRPETATRVREGDAVSLTLGGRRLEIRYLGDAHFPGDAVVWLPDERILFAGDHVYVDRILGILPQSNASTWLVAFDRIKGLGPKTIVPGHGSVADLAKAQADTGDYLAFIVGGVARYAEDLAGVDRAIAALEDAPQFSRLANFEALHRANVSRAYLRLESDR